MLFIHVINQSSMQIAFALWSMVIRIVIALSMARVVSANIETAKKALILADSALMVMRDALIFSIAIDHLVQAALIVTRGISTCRGGCN